jgi:hypothetical protein
MKKDTITIKRRQHATPKARKSGAAKLYALTLVCSMLVASGLFFAAHRHFSSVDYNMRNSVLRKQLDELEAEKRKLLLAREIALSPSEIKKASKKLGLDDVDSAGIQLASAVKDPKAAAPQPVPVKTFNGTSTALVVRTASVTSSARPQIAGQTKTDPANKTKKAKVQMTSVVAVR